MNKVADINLEKPLGTGTPVLKLEGVGRHYGSGDSLLRILNNTNLTIGQGEMVALVAPSGSGKSTLLHTAGLLEQPDAGDVFVDGHSTRSMEDDERTWMRRRKIGFVYQFHHLLPEFTALENLMLPQMIAGHGKNTARERAKQLLATMGISDRHDHRPSELSGGEQQRVAIARAVCNAPSILLADEPTGNLDPKTSDFVFGMLQELVRESGVCGLIATHNHELASRMDRVLTLENGQVVTMTL